MISAPKFIKTNAYFNKIKKLDVRPILERHGKMGVKALASSTPIDTGETSSKWSFKIEGNKNKYRLIWTNSEIAGDVPLVILLQYGHATKSGYFIPGRDFINPAMNPVYDSLLRAIGQEVKHG